MEYPKVIDENPLHIDAQALHEAVNRYYDDPIGDRVALAIAGYANSNGVAFPGFELLAELTGYTYEQISRATHRLQALGILKITRRRSKGAKYAHDVYKFCKRLIREVIDVCSAHFIANVEKWRAEGRDVAQAIKKKARQSLDALTAKAEKMAALFAEKPELMEEPEQAAQIAGVAGTPETVEIPAVSEPSEWESFDNPAPVAWEDSVRTEPEPVRTEPVQVQAAPPEPPQTETEPLRVYASWRDRVAAYRKETASA